MPMIAAAKIAAAAVAATSAAAPKEPLPDQAKLNLNNFNPQISIVGDFASVLHAPRGTDKRSDLRELEFGFAADADPFLRVEAYIGLHKHDGETETDIEEAFGRYSNLGKGLSAKFGKFAAAIGRVHRNHTDALGYLNYPMPLRDVLGEEGFRQTGASLSYLFPGDRFSELTLEVLDAGDNGPTFNTSHSKDPVYVGHFRTFFDFNDDLSAQLGVTYLHGPTGENDEIDKHGTEKAHHGGIGNMYGVDWTMKWQPAGVKGRSASLEAEAYWTKPTRETNRSFGWFGRFQYEVAPRWHLMLGYDSSQLPGTFDKREGWLAGMTFKVTEFHLWRLEFERIESNFERDRNVLTLQFQWTIGAHPAHKY